MPVRPRTPCTTPGCTHTATQGRCDTCRTRRTPTDPDRPYGAAWRARRGDYLTRNPWCTLCHHRATVADHYPTHRRRLVALGDPDPDADEHLRPLCDPCHRVETAKHQPGGWHRDQQ